MKNTYVLAKKESDPTISNLESQGELTYAGEQYEMLSFFATVSDYYQFKRSRYKRKRKEIEIAKLFSMSLTDTEESSEHLSSLRFELIKNIKAEHNQEILRNKREALAPEAPDVIRSQLQGLWVTNGLELMRLWTRKARQLPSPYVSALLGYYCREISVDDLKEIGYALWRDYLEDIRELLKEWWVTSCTDLLELWNANILQQFGSAIVNYVVRTETRLKRSQVYKFAQALGWSLEEDYRNEFEKIWITSALELMNAHQDTIKYSWHKRWGLKMMLETDDTYLSFKHREAIAKKLWWDLEKEIFLLCQKASNQGTPIAQVFKQNLSNKKVIPVFNQIRAALNQEMESDVVDYLLEEYRSLAVPDTPHRNWFIKFLARWSEKSLSQIRLYGWLILGKSIGKKNGLDQYIRFGIRLYPDFFVRHILSFDDAQQEMNSERVVEMLENKDLNFVRSAVKNMPLKVWWKHISTYLDDKTLYLLLLNFVNRITQSQLVFSQILGDSDSVKDILLATVKNWQGSADRLFGKADFDRHLQNKENYDYYMRGAMKYCKFDKNKAEDLLHDFFANIAGKNSYWLYRWTWYKATATLRSYLFRALKNYFLSTIKQQKINTVDIDEVYGTKNDLYTEQEHDIHYGETQITSLAGILKHAIKQLPAKLKTVFVLQQRGKSILEIAEEYDITESAVKMRLKRAKETLKIYLQKHHSDNDLIQEFSRRE